MNYWKYFFTGFKTADMDPFVLAVLKTVQGLVIVFIGSFTQILVDNLSKGNYAFDFATLQGYIMPGVVAVLLIINELFRKYTNPAVTIGQPTGVVRTLPPTGTGTY